MLSTMLSKQLIRRGAATLMLAGLAVGCTDTAFEPINDSQPITVAGSTFAAGGTSSTATGIIIPVSTAPNPFFSRPAPVSGDKVAYVAPGNVLTIFDAASMTREIVPTGGHPIDDVAMTGDQLVWLEAGDVYQHNLATHLTTRLTTDVPYALFLDVSDSHVVWTSAEGFSSTLFAMRLDGSGQPAFRVGSPAGLPGFVAISGEVVAWSDARNLGPLFSPCSNSNLAANHDVYMARLSSPGAEVQVTTDTNSQISPDISGSRIIWADTRHNDWTICQFGTSEIFGFDLGTSTEFRIASGGVAAISGTLVATGRPTGIDVLDLATGTSHSVTTSAQPFYLDFQGTTLTWRDSPGMTYMYRLPLSGPSGVTMLHSTVSAAAFDGSISDQSVASSLSDQLNAAGTSLELGRTQVATRQLTAFSRLVAAQEGRSIARSTATLLLSGVTAAVDAIDSQGGN